MFKNYYLFIWSSNLTWCLVFLFAKYGNPSPRALPRIFQNKMHQEKYMNIFYFYSLSWWSHFSKHHLRQYVKSFSSRANSQKPRFKHIYNPALKREDSVQWIWWHFIPLGFNVLYHCHSMHFFTASYIVCVFNHIILY